MTRLARMGKCPVECRVGWAMDADADVDAMDGHDAVCRVVPVEWPAHGAHNGLDKRGL